MNASGAPSGQKQVSLDAQEINRCGSRRSEGRSIPRRAGSIAAAGPGRNREGDQRRRSASAFGRRRAKIPHEDVIPCHGTARYPPFRRRPVAFGARRKSSAAKSFHAVELARAAAEDRRARRGGERGAGQRYHRGGVGRRGVAPGNGADRQRRRRGSQRLATGSRRCHHHCRDAPPGARSRRGDIPAHGVIARAPCGDLKPDRGLGEQHQAQWRTAGRLDLHHRAAQPAGGQHRRCHKDRRSCFGPDQSTGAQCRHRSGARRRSRPWLRRCG